MPTLHLTFKPDYVSWSTWEAIRELLQNAKDAEDLGYPMDINYNPKSKWLSIRTRGVVLENRHLVLGESDKRNNPSLRGKWGEGFKLAWACLLNNRKEIWIKNGLERWEPKIEFSKDFNTNIIAVKQTNAKTSYDGYYTEIHPIEPEEWEEIQEKCLFLKPPKSFLQVGAEQILTDPKERGNIFLQDLFVSHEINFHFGYNLNHLTIDRDRRIIDNFNLKNETQKILHKAVQDKQLDPSCIYQMIETHNAEVQYFIDYGTQNKDTWDLLAKNFKDKYGKKAFPVTSLQQATECSCLGYTGILVNYDLYEALRKTFGTFEELKEKFGYQLTTLTQLTDIPKPTLRILNKICKDLSGFMEISLNISDIQIGKFKDDGLRGFFQNQKISLSEKLLENPAQLVATLIHEFAHNWGKDGESTHRQAIEEIAAYLYLKRNT
jgi:hypothetical protein